MRSVEYYCKASRCCVRYTAFVLGALGSLCVMGACGSAAQPAPNPTTPDVPQNFRGRQDHSIVLVPTEEEIASETDTTAFLTPARTKPHIIPEDIYIGALQDTTTLRSSDRAVYTLAQDFIQALIADEEQTLNIEELDTNEITEEVRFLRGLESPPSSARIGKIEYGKNSITARTALHIQSREGHTISYLYFSRSESNNNDWQIARFVVQRDTVNTFVPISSLPFESGASQ